MRWTLARTLSGAAAHSACACWLQRRGGLRWRASAGNCTMFHVEEAQAGRWPVRPACCRPGAAVSAVALDAFGAKCPCSARGRGASEPACSVGFFLRSSGGVAFSCSIGSGGWLWPIAGLAASGSLCALERLADHVAAVLGGAFDDVRCGLVRRLRADRRRRRGGRRDRHLVGWAGAGAEERAQRSARRIASDMCSPGRH